MPRLGAAVCALLSACAAPGIPHVEAAAVRGEARAGQPVEVCALVQESAWRSDAVGVAAWPSRPWHYVLASVLVKHPAGWVIIDPAIGVDIETQLRRAGPLVTATMGDARTKTPLVQTLEAVGVSPDEVRVALLTHAHWDHTGALGDLPQARVLVARAELAWLQPFTRFVDHGAMPHHLRRVKARLRAFDFAGPPRDGFPGSFDLFGDGAVVGVPLPGHTPGSTGWLVRGEGGVTWLFSGDTTLTARGVTLPAHKSLRAYDEDLGALSSSLGVLHALSRHRPDVRVLPAHDGEALAQLPPCAPGR